MNIVLCGMMGAGKTTVGIALAELLNAEWRDTDTLIEEKYGKISEIFERYGETRFREMETETVRGLSQKDGYVISVGGGLVLKAENVTLLKTKGKIVYLRAKAETLEKRLRADTNRPLLHHGEESLAQRLQRLLKERGSVYESVADILVDVDELSPKEIAVVIAQKL